MGGGRSQCATAAAAAGRPALAAQPALASAPAMTTTSFFTAPTASQPASCRTTEARYVFRPSSAVTCVDRPYLATDTNVSAGYTPRW